LFGVPPSGGRLKAGTPNFSRHVTRFTKFQGFANDYLVFEAGQLAGVDDSQLCQSHLQSSLRRRGTASAIVARADDSDSDFQVRIFNPDGSEAGMSETGLGARVVSLLSRFFGRTTCCDFRHANGIKRYYLLERSDNGSFLFRSELGQPRFDSAIDSIPNRSPLDRVIDYPLEVAAKLWKVTALQMGNPNCCVFVDDFAAI